MSLKLVEETPQHFLMQHADGHQLRIAKKSLSEGMSNKIRKLAQGGQVNYGASDKNTIPADKSKDFRDGFNSQGQQAQPPKEQPKKIAKLYGGGKAVAKEEAAVESQMPDQAPAQNMNQEMAADPQAMPTDIQRSPDSGILDSLGQAMGKYVAAPVAQSFNDVADASGRLVGGAVRGGEKLAQGVKKGMGGSDAPVSPQSPVATPAAGKTAEAPPQFQNVNLGQPQGQQAQSQAPLIANYGKEFGQAEQQQIAGLRGEAEALGKQGEQEKTLYADETKKYEDLITGIHTRMGHLDTEIDNISKDVKEKKLDFNHFMNSQKTGDKLRMAIGMIIGGAGAGLSHTENPVMEFINKQIDRDIDEQKSDIGKKKTALDAYLHQYGNLKDAESALRLGYLATMEGKLKAIQGSNVGELAKQRAEQAIGALRAKMAPMKGELAVRQTVADQLTNGQQVDPAVLIRFRVPEHAQQEAHKELTGLQNLQKAGQNALGAFDKVNGMTLGGAFSPHARDSLLKPVIAQLSKDTAGRFTEQDSEMLAALFPAAGDSSATRVQKRQALVSLISAKMNSSLLQGYGIPAPRFMLGTPIQGGPGFNSGAQQMQPQQAQAGMLPAGMRR